MTFDRRRLLGAALAWAATLPLARGAWAADAAPALEAGKPSATARLAALSRAVHQLVDSPLVFEDPYAVPLVAPVSADELRQALDGSAGLRASIALRSRYAEDRLREAIARGVRQYVLLGAGLDTFVLRNPHASRGLKVFEVDHPATQRWKRERLKAAGLRPRPGATFVPVDFERQSLPRELARGGFRAGLPAFYSMLGVTIYLTDEAVMETMRMVAAGARGTEIVFSFSVPDAQLSEREREGRRRTMARMEAIGEPWITFYDPQELSARLEALGFSRVELLSPRDANARYLSGRGDGLRIATGYLAAARV